MLYAGPGLAQDFPDVCQQPENILRNCTFDGGLDQWQTFTEMGSASFSVLQGGGECHAPLCPAAYIVVEGHFIGGLFQQVPVTKGSNYYANIVWLVFDSLANDAGIHGATGGIGRRIGLDPFGGTDPASPNIVWAPDNWRNDCKICNIEQVTITAQADTITVFLRLDDTWKLRAAEKGFPVPPSKDKFWIDDIGLIPVGGEPIVAEPPPTDTPVPPPPTDTPPPAADTNGSEDTEQAEEAKATSVAAAGTPISEPISPVATPTPEPTNTVPPPPPTLTPTSTPLPTSTPIPQPSPTPTRILTTAPDSEATELPVMLSTAGTATCMGGLVLLIVSIIMAGLVWLYRLGWGGMDDDDDYYYDNDDEEEFPTDPPPTKPQAEINGESATVGEAKIDDFE